MIGIEFEYTKNYSNIFKFLFNGIDELKYEYDVHEFEVIYEDFTNVYENNFNMNKIINEKRLYQPLFVNIRFYLKDEKFEKIENYKDFNNSNCQLILLISDVFDVEIYFKENELKNLILNNLKENNIDYNIKTAENDERTIMYVN